MHLSKSICPASTPRWNSFVRICIGRLPMVVNWVKYCQSSDLFVEPPHIVVKFRDERRHRVTVGETNDEYVLSAFVVRQATVASLRELPLHVWVRNRAVSLVGFRIDHRERLVGEAWVPKAGITESEFQLYVRTLAIEADRFEYTL